MTDFKMLVCCAENDSHEASLLDDIANRPHKVFTDDLFFFMCCDSGLHYTSTCYEIHPKSPLSIAIRKVIVKFYINHRGHFKEQYRRDAAKNFPREVIYEKFRQTVDDFLSRLFSSDVTADEVLRRVMNAAMMSLDFYDLGFNDALKFCTNRMSYALEECNKRHNFRMFDLMAKEASDIMKA